jgi:hypothetical protein
METKIVTVVYTTYDLPNKETQECFQKEVDKALENAGEGWNVRSVESRVATNSGHVGAFPGLHFTARQFTVFLLTIILEK